MLKSPDLICFTGDLVNRNSQEAIPYKQSLSKLKSKDGVMSISGNHDHADYTDESEYQKHLDHLRLIDFEKSLGWTPLENEHCFIKRGNDSIAIIGLQNYGVPGKPNYGKYEVAYDNYNDETFKILLHHGSGLWRNVVIKHNYNVALTLSGHTHAMQCVIKIGSWRWSPISTKR